MEAPNKPNPEETPVHPDVHSVTRALAAPFDPAMVRFKPQVVNGNRALALAYVDARVIQDRLDEVLGAENWQDDYECLADGSVMCRLRIRLAGEWLQKVDVGGPSEQPDGGDRLKAAFSDALKRAAVKFGIGRYLYRLPAQWVEYDPHRRQMLKLPALPAFALPAKALPAKTEEAPAKKAVPAPRETAPAKKAATTRVAAGQGMPATGAELQRRLQDYDAKLAGQGLCPQGALVEHVIHAGARAGHGTDMTAWSGPAITLAIEETRAFEAQARKTQPQQKDVA